MAIYLFGDSDDMFEQMRRDQEAADACVKPWQATIKAGEFVVRDSDRGFAIYSEILPDPEEREPHLQHYRFTRSYSIACPNGELGDLHVSTIERKLTEEEFRAAEDREWSE